MNYKEHAKERVEQFKNDLVKIINTKYSSKHLLIVDCNELLNSYRVEFNKCCRQGIFGEISVLEYVNCLSEYTQAQQHLELTLNPFL